MSSNPIQSTFNLHNNVINSCLNQIDTLKKDTSLSHRQMDAKIKSIVLDQLSSIEKEVENIPEYDRPELASRVFAAISTISSPKDKIELQEKLLLTLNMLSKEDKVGHQLRYLMSNVKSATQFNQIEALKVSLEEIANYLRVSDTPPHLKAQFLSVCDQFSHRLLDDKQWQGTATNPHPLDGNANWNQRVMLAAGVRHLASICPVGAKTLQMDTFKSSSAPQIALIGKKMDPGVHYQHIDSQDIKGNQVAITRRNVIPQAQGGKGEQPQPETRTQLNFHLTEHARLKLDVTLNAMQNQDVGNALGAHFGTKVTVKEDVQVNYEISQSGLDHKGITEFKESGTNFAKMTSIEFEGIGQILIGNEDMSVSSKADSGESTKGRYVAHHTVIVRLKDHANDDDELGFSAQFQRMHQLLAAVGLSSVLTSDTPEVRQKNQVMHIIETYLPSLAIQIRNGSDFPNLTADDLKTFCDEILPAQSETGMTQSAMKSIFDLELQEGKHSEVTTLGNEVPKLSTVAAKMKEQGAVGFFAGISGGPGVVASVLKTGPLASDTRSAMGFMYPSTCQEDAITGGNEAVFVRVATEGGIKQMEEGKSKLSQSPYINTYQMIVSLEAANLPSNMMHHNHFGLINPHAEIVVKTNEGEVKVSGAELLQTEDPITFAKNENEHFSPDNECMLRVQALNPQYIQKITYQDPRKALLIHLRDNGCPQDLVEKMEQKMTEGGNIEGDLQKGIEKFLQEKGLVTKKTDKWSQKEYDALTQMKSEFDFGEKLTAFFVDPKAALIKELKSNGIIDENNLVFGQKRVDEFIVETETLTKELFQ